MARPREFDVDSALAGIQGLRLVGKANPDREVLEDIAKLMLHSLDV